MNDKELLAYLRSSFNYDPATGLFTHKEKRSFHEGAPAGCLNRLGYVILNGTPHTSGKSESYTLRAPCSRFAKSDPVGFTYVSALVALVHPNTLQRSKTLRICAMRVAAVCLES